MRESDVDNTATGDAADNRNRRFVATLVRFMEKNQITTQDIRRLCTPEMSLKCFATSRIQAELVHRHTGLASEVAQNLPADVLQQCIETAIRVGTAKVGELAASFPIEDLVAHGNLHAIWQTIRDRIPWNDTDGRFATFILRECLEILTPLQLRLAIEPEIWQERIPAKLRAAVDRARLLQELDDPGRPYTAADEMKIVTTETVGEHIALKDLVEVWNETGKAMGFAEDASPKG